MTINEMCVESWQVAEEKGFHEGRLNSRDDTLVRLCLVHTEVTEAAQVVKRHWPTSGACSPVGEMKLRCEMLAEELADTLIRIGDLAQCCGLDLEKAVEEKMAKNRERPHLYGTSRAASV